MLFPISLKNNYRGQAVIVVLLVMVVALTVGLSISAQSIRDVRIATRTEESQRAFSAAEAGLEVALQAGSGVIETNLGSNVTYQVGVTNVGGANYFIFPEKIARDDVQQIWLKSHNTTGDFICIPPADPCYTGNKIGLYWGNFETAAGDIIPALEVGIIYAEGGVYKIKKYVYDPNIGRAAVNNFDDDNVDTVVGVGYNIGEATKLFKYRVTDDLVLPNGIGIELIALRLRLLYTNSKQLLGVKAVPNTAIIPVQGKLYDSKGEIKMGDQASEVRRILFFKSYPFLPGIFDYALYSGSNLSKPAP